MISEVNQIVSEAANEGFALHFDNCCVICGEATPGTRVGSVRDHEYSNTTQLTFPVMECPRCKTLYLYPRPDEKELSRIYPANYYANHLANLNKQKRLTAVEEVLERRTQSTMQKRLQTISIDPPQGRPLRILDIGCGTGRHLDLLRSIFPSSETHGIDMSESAVYATAASGHQTYLGRFEDVRLPKTYFDLIISFHVIEHVARPDLFLERCRDLIQPAGKILIETPNTDCWEFRWFKKSHWGGYHPPRHWYLFQYQSMQFLAGRTDLKIIGYGQYTNAFFLAWTLHSIWEKKFGKAFADILFPPVRIYFGGLYCLMLLGSLSIFSNAMQALTGDASSMWIAFEKH